MDKFVVHGMKAQINIYRDKVVNSPSCMLATPSMNGTGDGSGIWDIDVDRFREVCAGIAVRPTGQSHSVAVETIKQQVERLLYISSDFYHPAWIELSERLASIAPYKESAFEVIEFVEIAITELESEGLG